MRKTPEGGLRFEEVVILFVRDLITSIQRSFR
jgi:hypothetical protein